MPIKTLCYIFFVFFIIPLSAIAEPNLISLRYPPDNAVMEFDLLSISMSIPEGSADVLTVKVKDRETIRIVPDLKYECFSVPLSLGINNIEIMVTKDGSTVYRRSLNVFRRSELVAAYINPPAGYKKNYFHGEDNAECTECHILEPGEYDRKPISPASFTAGTSDKKTVLSVTSTCYSCHNKIASYPYVHGPVAVWSCLSCHDPESDPVYLVKKPDTEVCFKCHIEQKLDWESKKYTHGPVTIGKCAICHSPHASQYPSNLYMKTWDLCVNCHAAKGTGKHVLGDSFSTEGHPTRDRPDPVRTGKELSCASCHSSHASNYPHLWAFEVKTMFELCQKCHNK